MFVELVKDSEGTLYCSPCQVPLKLQDKVVGLQAGRQFDLLWCPLCTKLYWLPPRSSGPRNIPAGVPQVIDV